MESSRGLLVTTSSVEVVESIDHFHHQIVSMGPDAGLILDAVAANPDNVLLNTYAAAFYNYAQEDAANAVAKEFLIQAERSIKQANVREQLTYQGVLAWNKKDYEAAITLFTSLTQIYPRDTLAAKFAEWVFYCSGQKYHAHRYLALCTNMAMENQNDSHFLAMHSFALELSGHLQDAKNKAETAIAIELITPWAHHTLGHVYLMANESKQGSIVLENLRSSWDLSLPLIKGHNLWHLALLYLTYREEQKVLALYPEIFDPSPELTSAQIDIISLLWRLDLAGMPQDKAFKDAATKLHNHPFEQHTGFNSAHFVYCLARAGEKTEVIKAIKAIEHYAHSLPEGYYKRLWSLAILPFCKAIQAFVNADFKSAQSLLSPALEQCFQIGGSDAQSELVTQTYLQCLLHLNKTKEAKDFFTLYLSHYKNTPLADYWFSTGKK